MSIEPVSQAAACLTNVGRSIHSADIELNYTYRLAVEVPADRVRVATGEDLREVFTIAQVLQRDDEPHGWVPGWLP